MTFEEKLKPLLDGFYTGWQWAMDLIPDEFKLALLIIIAVVGIFLSGKGTLKLISNIRNKSY